MNSVSLTVCLSVSRTWTLDSGSSISNSMGHLDISSHLWFQAQNWLKSAQAHSRALAQADGTDLADAHSTNLAETDVTDLAHFCSFWLISLSSGSFKDWLISLSLILNLPECHCWMIWLSWILSFSANQRDGTLFDGLRILNSKVFRLNERWREVSHQFLLWWGLWISSSWIPFACCRRERSCLGHFAKASFGTPLLWHRQSAILNGFQSSCLCGWTLVRRVPSSSVAYRTHSPAYSVAVWLLNFW
jgi:hypothetical protein